MLWGVYEVIDTRDILLFCGYCIGRGMRRCGVAAGDGRLLASLVVDRPQPRESLR